MAPYLEFPAPLRRFAATAKTWPLALLAVVALAGCGTADDLDGPDPALYTDVAAETAPAPRLLAAQSVAPLETSDADSGFAGATERPAPTSSIPVVRGKPR